MITVIVLRDSGINGVLHAQTTNYCQHNYNAWLPLGSDRRFFTEDTVVATSLVSYYGNYLQPCILSLRIISHTVSPAYEC